MEGTITAERLHEDLLTKVGINCEPIHSSLNSAPLATGRIAFIPLCEHLQLHFSHCTERHTTSNSSVLSPSVNITLLLKGKVAFRLGTRHYTFDAQQQPQAFVTLVANDEPFTRYLTADQTIKKVTVTVTQDWLIERFSQQAAHLFSSSKVMELNGNAELIEFADYVFGLSSELSPFQRLHAEGATTAWLSEVMPFLINDNQATSACYRVLPNEDIEVKKHQMVALLDANLPLEDIAQRLAMSVSRFQRFFRQHFHTTPKQYTKQRNLHKARHALLINGLSIGEAAFLANYDHVGNFIAAFKKQFGITPMQFVKQHRETPQRS